MNEQQSADLFSQQLDRLLQGQTPTPPPPGDEGFQELLSLADELSQVSFQAGPIAQAAFQSQLESWFGPGSGPTIPGPKYGRWNTMAGKLIALIVSILVAVAIGALTLVIAILVVIRAVIPGVTPGTPTPTLTGTPPATATTTPVSSLTSTPVASGTVTSTLMPSPTIVSTIDTIDTITVVVTIEIDIDDLVPGQLPHDGGDHDDDDDDDDDDHNGYQDHNRGHGNDPDHHDEDNPGRGHH